MFPFKTLPEFTSSALRGFFAVRLLAFCSAFLSGLSADSKKPLFKLVAFCGVDLVFDVALKSTGSIVIPVLSLMGETK